MKNSVVPPKSHKQEHTTINTKSYWWGLRLSVTFGEYNTLWMSKVLLKLNMTIKRCLWRIKSRSTNKPSVWYFVLMFVFVIFLFLMPHSPNQTPHSDRCGNYTHWILSPQRSKTLKSTLKLIINIDSTQDFLLSFFEN